MTSLSLTFDGVIAAGSREAIDEDLIGILGRRCTRGLSRCRSEDEEGQRSGLWLIRRLLMRVINQVLWGVGVWGRGFGY